ncbi:hypothetical protein KPZU09_66360 [Klebsiella pneumoniae]|uniref:Bacterial microcompartment domain-containing protein n=1 Tax=Klebsiella pneumoniae TaxID=573 RepID=A0A919HZ94_KLEPN|nr:hypothetical protein KPZU09_66360 [Klebsiella pneumoniae]
MVVKIAGDVASVRAAVMTGAELAERQQGLVAQKVIAGPGRPAAGPCPAPSPAPDVAVTEENTALTDAPSHSTERVTCNLCLDPHCPRQKGDPRSQCLHAGKRGDA